MEQHEFTSSFEVEHRGRRTLWKAGCVLVVAALLSGCASLAGARDSTGTLDVAYVGNVWPNDMSEDPNFARYWNQVTPENGGKWGIVEATRDRMHWEDLDNAYRESRELGIPFRLHTLIWGQQQPSWLASLSPSDQRREIEEWFQALAARYHDIEYIDVVNEPLHAPPVYREALGGDGRTGWDWVVSAFELAREYFPRAELHLNDYNILAYPEEATRYVEIVAVLQERGLIDGIGVQAHSLEQTRNRVIRSTLDALAETQLPIYVTELDVSFSQDLRQAHRLRELVTLFADHPAVRGITLWGYLEGRTWKENAYLLRADGTPRPGLEWLSCVTQGEADADCELPPYEPAARTGDGNRVRIEAEEFDETEGVEAAGSMITYVDDGDWALYNTVLFHSSYTSLRIRYAKGNDALGVVEFRPRSLEAEPVLSVELEPTGGWNTFETIELDWPPLKGPQDLYLTFANTEGVGNIDWIEIGRPGRTGTGDQLELEAESADDQAGVEVYGSFIGYADGGDWLKFSQVELRAEYTAMDVVYGRDAADPGGLEVRIGAPDGPVAARLDAVTTGGWNSFETHTVPFAAEAGVYDVYVIFTGAENLGNFDRLVIRPGE
ncbi:MAG: endo-1,4-beta-xylanase [Spirochaetota bacterium]